METKELTDKVAAQIEAGDLYALLSVCNNEDLDPLVTIILSATTNAIDNDPEFKAHRPDHVRYYKKIGDEFRKFGGNSIANLFRGGGPEYAEIVRDVCEKLGVPNKPNETRLNELRLLASTYIKSQLEEDAGKQAPDHIDDAGARAGSISNNKGTVLAGAALFAVSGPAGLAFAGWKLLDTAYRITVPCVLHIARIRTEFLGVNVNVMISALPIKPEGTCPYCRSVTSAIIFEKASTLSPLSDTCVCPECGKKVHICRTPMCDNYAEGEFCQGCLVSAARAGKAVAATVANVVVTSAKNAVTGAKDAVVDVTKATATGAAKGTASYAGQKIKNTAINAVLGKNIETDHIKEHISRRVSIELDELHKKDDG